MNFIGNTIPNFIATVAAIVSIGLGGFGLSNVSSYSLPIENADYTDYTQEDTYSTPIIPKTVSNYKDFYNELNKKSKDYIKLFARNEINNQESAIVRFASHPNWDIFVNHNKISESSISKLSVRKNLEYLLDSCIASLPEEHKKNIIEYRKKALPILFSLIKNDRQFGNDTKFIENVKDFQNLDLDYYPINNNSREICMEVFMLIYPTASNTGNLIQNTERFAKHPDLSFLKNHEFAEQKASIPQKQHSNSIIVVDSEPYENNQIDNLSEGVYIIMAISPYNPLMNEINNTLPPVISPILQPIYMFPPRPLLLFKGK